MTTSREKLDRAKTLAAYWGIPWHQVEITAHTTGLSYYAAIDLIAEIVATPVTETDLSGLQRTRTLKPNPSRPAPINGPTGCHNCNHTYRGTCRKCAGSIRIQTQGRTRK